MSSDEDVMPLVALLPAHCEFDEEEKAAALVLPVFRFTFGDDVALLSPPPASPCRAIHRGFMLSAERYAQLEIELRKTYNLVLVVTAEEYEAAHYYPNSYQHLLNAGLTPPALWQPVPEPATVTEECFQEVFEKICSEWPARYTSVLLKDYVKSAKATSQRFQQVPVNSELPEMCCELVAARGVRFNRGVVLKAWVQLALYPNRGGFTTNEWRLFFGRGSLLSMEANSYQDADTAPPPPEEVVARAEQVAHSVSNPYFSLDLAETEEEGWIALEIGDGGVSGPAPGQDLNKLW
eukprot:CAMPEP_0206422260 /NCGR_PEP_ID=MMETSP0324_2-20121206/1969_1 /ASSEMBLY_ACC=CAM_ASM_000836 /TAXON_ID=2866 /ORGANISM="Crypthecodinium cohnii, Strain Seligo" /LENGTH=292 /DNA_ID=CAMNT_0053886575 /DNA_START=11 /DNA_END=886 /DNA_ORIENTATION=+